MVVENFFLQPDGVRWRSKVHSPSTAGVGPGVGIGVWVGFGVGVDVGIRYIGTNCL